MTTGRVCQGCGGRVPTSKGGPARKWCSEKCRKASYGDPCVDCGARTCYGSESARVPEPRCTPCRQRRDALRRAEKALAMLKLRREGLSNIDVAERTGLPIFTVRNELHRLRALGYEMPTTGYRSSRFRVEDRAVSPEAKTLEAALALYDEQTIPLSREQA